MMNTGVCEKPEVVEGAEDFNPAVPELDAGSVVPVDPDIKAWIARWIKLPPGGSE